MVALLLLSQLAWADPDATPAEAPTEAPTEAPAEAVSDVLHHVPPTASPRPPSARPC